jgi:hypothetical protein
LLECGPGSGNSLSFAIGRSEGEPGIRVRKTPEIPVVAADTHNPLVNTPVLLEVQEAALDQAKREVTGEGEWVWVPVKRPLRFDSRQKGERSDDQWAITGIYAVVVE